MGTHPIFESDFDCLTDVCVELQLTVFSCVERPARSTVREQIKYGGRTELLPPVRSLPGAIDKFALRHRGAQGASIQRQQWTRGQARRRSCRAKPSARTEIDLKTHQPCETSSALSELQLQKEL